MTTPGFGWVILGFVVTFTFWGIDKLIDGYDAKSEGKGAGHWGVKFFLGGWSIFVGLLLLYIAVANNLITIP